MTAETKEPKASAEPTSEPTVEAPAPDVKGVKLEGRKLSTTKKVLGGVGLALVGFAVGALTMFLSSD